MVRQCLLHAWLGGGNPVPPDYLCCEIWNELVQILFCENNKPQSWNRVANMSVCTCPGSVHIHTNKNIVIWQSSVVFIVHYADNSYAGWSLGLRARAEPDGGRNCNASLLFLVGWYENMDSAFIPHFYSYTMYKTYNLRSHTCIHIYIHIYIHTCIHTYICIYIYAYQCVIKCFSRYN